MSDLILSAQAYRPKSAAPRSQAGAPGEPRRRRMKVLGDVVDYVTEVMAEMERGRQQHPVISAYRP
jgi:hypothetical protein